MIKGRMAGDSDPLVFRQQSRTVELRLISYTSGSSRDLILVAI